MKQYQKYSTKKILNTVNTSIHITKTPTYYKTHTYTYPHITKQVKTIVQVKTNTVQEIPKWNSHNISKYPQYKVTLMHKKLLSPRTSP
jgi:methylmalonyl-CoA mutase N-terminal domain/subunit